ncbi:ribosome biogenesis GTPase Der [Rubellicoccus peritrichatus]|uniref:GTPase Der n=1 Tax=Rubellicoccus peritrichatus TaxID=3080537 RepID=A0AAQ3L836_9BACT|nr:ribosome biogenesis GTPase Der [Puniceicoccus sp. CR14]WOO41399.1 ribosome biogenesis GTPase Der [Puniceicoccus sp. CR14]
MIPPERTVAIVGRPNVGKSRLFNRLVGKRMAIVHDMPGVTRDLASAEVEDNYNLLDTGGIGMKPEMTPQMIHDATEEQVDFAVQAASVIVFVTDGIEGLTVIDEELAKQFRRYGKPVVLVVNKIDKQSAVRNLDDFFKLGLGDPQAISAEHGDGVDVLHEVIVSQMPPYKPPFYSKKEERRIRICLCGRPNVGKSSLGNRLLKAPRLIVSEVAGTTRDAIETDLDYTDSDGTELKFRLMDTAGVKPRRKLGSSLDYFSGLRTSGAIERTDIAFLVLDAMTGVTKHDKTLAGEVLKFGKGLVIVVNKWDLALEQFREQPVRGYETEKEFREAFAEAVDKELFFLPKSPILFVSAVSGFKVESILKAARTVDVTSGLQLPTGALNKTLSKLMDKQAPRIVGKKRFKVYYSVHVSSRPITIRMFCNREEQLDDRYRRYLETGLREAFQLEGCPIRLDLVGKPQDSNPYHTPLAPGKDRKAKNTLDKHSRGKKRST